MMGQTAMQDESTKGGMSWQARKEDGCIDTQNKLAEDIELNEHWIDRQGVSQLWVWIIDC